ncbi:hypothetical protein RJ639_000103 [Escallonia herrerae]|uniref:Protein transport protein SEC23 n=1 Tax=Escallonia herrerae TaxID=1293975 RepID=A0AA88XBL7_9ASTE|nr:hypothetical protein RJ639_000103 [Escallonia herrerae]
MAFFRYCCGSIESKGCARSCYRQICGVGKTVTHFFLAMLLYSFMPERVPSSHAADMVGDLARTRLLRVETIALYWVEFDPIRWLDKSLIQICSRFGDYQKDSPYSFILSPRFSIYPQFIFHLHRSQFVQVDIDADTWMNTNGPGNFVLCMVVSSSSGKKPIGSFLCYYV